METRGMDQISWNWSYSVTVPGVGDGNWTQVLRKNSVAPNHWATSLAWNNQDMLQTGKWRVGADNTYLQRRFLEYIAERIARQA